MKYPSTPEEMAAAIIEEQLRWLERATKDCAGTTYAAEIKAMLTHVKAAVPLSRREVGRLNTISKSVALSNARAKLRAKAAKPK
jgi:hypothetical protein